MFYCTACAKKYTWPDWGSTSYGPCEICGKTAGCFDVPSRYLPDPVSTDDA
jgi:hypothetical protein